MPRRRWTGSRGGGGGGVGVDTSELQMLARDFQAVGARVHRVYLPEMLRSAAVPVELEAKSIASAHSQTIPPTIKTVVYRSLTVAVKAGTRQVQLAALYEEGNAGRGKPGSFNHPVFAKGPRETWHWTKTPQPGYPFLRPALIASAPKVNAALGRVADQMTATLARKAGSLVEGGVADA